VRNRRKTDEIELNWDETEEKLPWHRTGWGKIAIVVVGGLILYFIILMYYFISGIIISDRSSDSAPGNAPESHYASIIYAEFVGITIVRINEHAPILSNQIESARQNPELMTNQVWITATALHAYRIREIATDAIEYNVESIPLEFEEVHNLFVLFCNTHLKAIAFFKHGVDSADIDSLVRALDSLDRAAGYINQVNDAMLLVA